MSASRVPAGETGRSVLEQIWARPTCEVNGISGGYTGDGFKTVIPAEGVGQGVVPPRRRPGPGQGVRELPRLRPRPHAGRLHGRVHRHGGSPRASSLPLDGPDLAEARQALTEEWGREPALVGAGGSIPVVGDFKPSSA